MLVLVRRDGSTVELNVRDEPEHLDSLQKLPALANEIRLCHLRAARMAANRRDLDSLRRHLHAARIYATLVADLTADLSTPPSVPH